jgi:hypothetical protein
MLRCAGLRRRALLVGVLVGVLAAIAAGLMPHPIRLGGVELGDIGLPLAGLHQFEQGHSPYDVRLRGSTPALYPFTTLIVLWPLTLLPLSLVVPCFAGLLSACLAYAIMRREEPWRLLMFASPAYLAALHSVQWSPLITASILLPALLPCAIVKPQLGLVLAACGRWSKWTIGVTAALVLMSLAIWPLWPVEWIRHGNLLGFNGYSPIVIIPGALLLAAGIAWRSREGRLLLAMSIVVQRYLYDQLPLYCVARTPRQLLLMLATSWTMIGVVVELGWLDATGAQQKSVWSILIVALFLPALGIVLYNHWRPPELETTAL